MPNCQEHDCCDLLCALCGDYYCRAEEHRGSGWIHRPWPSTPIARPDNIRKDNHEH